MAIERHPVTDRASWLALRRQDVTASTAGALLGVHEYTTPYELWALKAGHLAEPDDDSPSMRRGRLLEPVALQLLAEEHPEWEIEPGRSYYRDPLARLGATPDALAADPERGPGIIQVKTVEPGVFRRGWRDADTGEVELPLWIAVQAIVEAHLTGAQWATVAAMTVGHGIDIHLIDVPIHAGVVERVRDAVKDFWSLVESGRAPEPDYGRDGEVIAAMFRASDGQTVDLPGDEAFLAMLGERERLSADRKAADLRLKEINTAILAALGPAECGRLPNGILISAKTVHRGEYMAKATSFRTIRITKGA